MMQEKKRKFKKEMYNQIIEKLMEGTNLPKKHLCELLGYSSQNFYQRIKTKPERFTLLELVKLIPLTDEKAKKQLREFLGL